MFIVSLTYKTQLSQVDNYINEHIIYLEKYYNLGKFLVSGRKIPRDGGIILVNATDRSELDLIIKEDPFYIADIANYDITEFMPTMTKQGLDIFKTYI
ncbi:YciI family protein [Pseudoalteromonas denitrificans]|uniref:Uncharacterized conserved protein YciI, contains a putative active-site phosphohistidine n=1 Tax=Pseudoalteromonas denitrificans DSM 6059 TaxID=1123010 RepID=A0A1I1MWK9_9GAMM|nr:YciI family protein [Pseudoalteromonas denitrificans]SFC89781.1 Uncharacterized conserved protein YciI, contains a putative active-site phosphohistidine [Pseudoalteromonas denitrificans DSM 6059]